VAIQDDRREIEMRKLFDLQDGKARGGTDAYLELDGELIPFELKSTTKSGFTTGRDVGRDHFVKWRRHHWLLSVYEANGTTIKYSYYGSPRQMEPWIREKEQYVSPDFLLAECVPSLLTTAVVHRLIGNKTSYTLEDAKKIQKDQYSDEAYRQKMDLPAAYSPQTMLEIIQDRCRYILERGATLNNPHIPGGYFKNWEKLTQTHAVRLRELVRLELAATKK
jgi:hypothetical protein